MAALEFLKPLHIANKGYLDISIWHEMDGAMAGEKVQKECLNYRPTPLVTRSLLFPNGPELVTGAFRLSVKIR